MKFKFKNPFKLKEKVRIKDSMTVILKSGGKQCVKH